MRGDILQLNGNPKYQNTPLLATTQNLISFRNATASATMTMYSVPYMLTRAVPSDFNQAISETSIISVFNKLKFNTAWLGVQNLNATYGPIATEAKHFVLTRHSGKTYDESLIPLLNNYLKKHHKQNNFIVLHLMGSHWNFEDRYTPDFKKFTPTCDQKMPGNCSIENLYNSYNNSILYTDSVLNEILKSLQNANAVVFFSSDHGSSLLDDGYFGHGYQGDNIPLAQKSIGMFVWMSDPFLETHHNYHDILKSKINHPVSHDNLFHSILGCTDIKSDLVDKKLNLCNSSNQ